uniref:Uncharacterized protein n=1 Tax=Anguilla anguilla TaxID=7936 RepID=A0A0E9RUM5_ANGAN
MFISQSSPLAAEITFYIFFRLFRFLCLCHKLKMKLTSIY